MTTPTCPVCKRSDTVGPQYADGEHGVLPVEDMYFCRMGCGASWDESKRRPLVAPDEAGRVVPKRDKQAAFMDGVGYACAELIRLFDQPSMAKEIFRNSGAKLKHVNEYDRTWLRRLSATHGDEQEKV